MDTHSKSSVVAPGFARVYAYNSAGRYVGWQENSDNPDYNYIANTRVYDLLSNVLEERIEYQYTRLNGSAPEYLYETDYIKKWEYDDIGNLVASLTGDGRQIESYTYDESLNLKTKKDARGYTSSFSYDDENRIKSKLNDDGYSLEYGYDLLGRVSSITDFKGNETTYEWSGERSVVVTSPDSGSNKIDYDAAGNVVKQLKNGDIEIDYTYDALNRLKTVRTSGDSSSSVSIDYYYDSYGGDCLNGIGRICAVQDQSGTTTFSYNQDGSLASYRFFSYLEYFEINYQYDSYGRLSIESYDDGLKIKYGYGQDSVLNSVQVQINGVWKPVVSVSPPAPKSKELTFGDGLKSTYSYNENGGLIRIANPVYLKEYSLSNDNFVNGENKIGKNLTNKSWHSYYYDSEGRIVDSYPSGTAQDFAKGAEHWEYDANGNRTKYTNNGRTETWEYFSDSNIQSKYNGNTRNRYDAQGNITSLLWVYNFKYDDLGRVKELDYPAPLDISLTINYQNHRVAKQVTDRLSNNTRYQSFIFDHTGRLVGEKYYARIFEGVTNRKHYIYFAVEIVGYVLNNELYFVHNDHLGRPEVITDSVKNVAWQAKYDIFGSRSLLTSNQALDFQIGLPGQYWEMYAGSWYNWNRYYDSSTGRYLQSDPIGLAGRINTYAYAGNNPLRYIDPTGEFFTPVAGAAAGATAGALGGAVGTLFAGGSLSDAAAAAVDGALMGGSAGFLAGLCGGCAIGAFTGAGFGVLSNAYTGAGIANSVNGDKESAECN
ncbi:RHS repeat-associated core domain-containing protein [Teredinibacter turnerae]|uniref:RHS repeat-associated core domain-containing protein n=1 Tax=Teredinibacter turnerae TaxID=2426 RepID=UPI0003A74474|nr:RHS repeat-associated core domain-containing protein [Teredinibacter turnerae]